MATYDPRELDAALAQTAEPVRQQLVVLDREIQRLEDEAKALRAIRGKARKVLNALGNEQDGKPGPKPSSRPYKHGNATSAETQQKVLDYVREKFGPGVEITGPKIHDAPDSPASHSVVTRALRDLHETGELRLLRHGDGLHNRTKVYLLTEGGKVNGDTS